MQEQYVRYYSHHLGREIEMLVFGHGGYPVLLFPTSMGRYFESKDFKLIESARYFIETGLVQIFCPDSIDAKSWYNRGLHPAQRVQAHMRYDAFLYDELTPFMLAQTAHRKVVAAGCSFGGYHAANFAFRHPECVSHLYSLAGAFDIKGQLDGFYNDDVYFNNPVDFIQNASNPELWQMRIVLGTSDRDICLGSNQYLSQLLSAKGIQHWLDIRRGEHDWPIWREMFPHYLSLI